MDRAGRERAGWWVVDIPDCKFFARRDVRRAIFFDIASMEAYYVQDSYLW
jgi:hypothetical protein